MQINIDYELQRILDSYDNAVKKLVEEKAKEAAKEAVEELKRTSPKRAKGGKYAKGWKVKKEGPAYIVHNKICQLTHLLENGHLKKGGKGFVKGIPHIKPAEEKAAKNFENKLQEIKELYK